MAIKKKTENLNDKLKDWPDMLDSSVDINKKQKKNHVEIYTEKESTYKHGSDDGPIDEYVVNEDNGLNYGGR